MTSDVTVRNNPEAPTYDAIIDDEVVGRINYELKGSRAVISHTIVEPAQRGNGIATALVKGALDDFRERGMTITNYCGFITAFISKNPQYADIVDPAEPGFAFRP
jgi:predicted GNAT family acetyltransferase